MSLAEMVATVPAFPFGFGDADTLGDGVTVGETEGDGAGVCGVGVGLRVRNGKGLCSAGVTAGIVTPGGGLSTRRRRGPGLIGRTGSMMGACGRERGDCLG